MHLRQNVWPHESSRGSFSPSSVKGSKQIMHSPAMGGAAESIVVVLRTERRSLTHSLTHELQGLSDRLTLFFFFEGLNACARVRERQTDRHMVEEEEIEALEAIYGADCVVNSRHPLAVTLHVPLDGTPQEGAVAEMAFKCPGDGSYPDRSVPKLDVKLNVTVDFFSTALYRAVREEGMKNCLGGPMIFSLAQFAKEYCEDVLCGRRDPHEDEDDEDDEEDEEDDGAKDGDGTEGAEGEKTEALTAAERQRRSKGVVDENGVLHMPGTQVTRESFIAWAKQFAEKRRLQREREEQLEMQRNHAEYDRKQAMVGRLTGKQLFERDKSLVASDAKFDASFVPSEEDLQK